MVSQKNSNFKIPTGAEIPLEERPVEEITEKGIVNGDYSNNLNKLFE